MGNTSTTATVSRQTLAWARVHNIDEDGLRRLGALESYCRAYFTDNEYNLMRYHPREIRVDFRELMQRKGITEFSGKVESLHLMVKYVCENRTANVFTMVPMMEYAYRVYLSGGRGTK